MDKFTISLKQLLTGAFAIVTAVAAATFTITTLSTSSHISALQLQVNMLDGRVRELQTELDRRHTSSNRSSEHQIITTPDNGDSQPSITFVNPQDGTNVSQFTDIEYSVSGDIPQRYRPILVIRDPLGQYWSWGTSANGRHFRVQVGVASDIGSQFEIGILITNRDFPMGQPTLTLPDGLLYRAITVNRR